MLVLILLVSALLFDTSKQVAPAQTAAESLKLESGEVKISHDAERCKYTVTLNSKTILRTTCEGDGADDWQVSIFAYYRYPPGTAGDLIIFEQTTGGNACEGSYRFLTINAKGGYSLSEAVGNCAFPTLTFGSDKVTIRFPGGKLRPAGSAVAPEAYTYHSGKLRPQKPARK